MLRHVVVLAALACLTAGRSAVAAERALAAAAAIGERHHARILFAPASLGETALSDAAVARIEAAASVVAALDRLVEGTGWQWSRDREGSYVVAPAAAGTATLALDPLEIVAPSATDVARLRQVPVERAALAAVYPSTLDEADLAHEPDLRADRLGRRVPNVTGSGARFALRGIARDDAFGATSSVTLDGLPVSPLALDRDALDLFGLDGIAYERGPASSRLGPFSLAGLVRLESRAPDDALALDGTAELDAHGSRRAAARIAAPFDPDARLAAAVGARTRREFDGTRRIVADGGDETSSHRVDAASAQVRYGSEDERAAFALVAHRIERDGDPATLVPPLRGEVRFDPFDRRTAGAARDEAVDATLFGFTGSLALGDPGRLWLTLGRSETDLAALERPSRFDRDRQIAADAWRRGALWYRHAFGPTWSAVAGVERIERDVANAALDEIDLQAYFPASVLVTPQTTRTLYAAERSLLDADSVVLELSRAGPRLALSAGARALAERRRERTAIGTQLSEARCEIELGSARTPCAAQFPTRATEVEAETDGDIVLPTASAVLTLDRGYEAGLHYRTGYRSGGARYDRTRDEPTRFGPERSTALEADLSWRPRDRALEVRLAAFAQRWRDRQVQIPLSDPGRYEVANAGRARSHGAELEIEWTPDPSWRLGAGLGWLDTRFDRFEVAGITGPVDVSGNDFPDAPELTLSAAARYGNARGWYVGVQAWYAAAAYSDVLNTEAGRRGGYRVIDLRAGRRIGSADVYFSLGNVTDAEWLESITLRGNAETASRYVVGPPRTAAIGLTWAY